MRVEDLKIIIFKSPYHSMNQNNFAQLMFGKIINNRIRTYLNYHGSGVFPLGAEDFIADHIIVAHSENDFFEPIASIKMITKDTCELFGQKLPIQAWLQDKANDNDVYDKVKMFLETNSDICYTGSYSCIKVNDDIDGLVHKLIAIGIYNLMKSKLCKHNFAAGLKTGQRFMHYVGWELFDEKVVTVPDINREKGYIYKLTDFSESLLSDNRELSRYWDDRIEISELESYDQNEVEAA